MRPSNASAKVASRTHGREMKVLWGGRDEPRQLCQPCANRLTIGSSDHGAHLRWANEGVDDLDKSASLNGNATPRRSTSSLEAMRDWTAIPTFDRVVYFVLGCGN
jgi:hypothetical protein